MVHRVSRPATARPRRCRSGAVHFCMLLCTPTSQCVIASQHVTHTHTTRLPTLQHHPPWTLQVSLLARLELRAAAAALRVEQLRALVVRSASEYRCLFSWLLGVVRALDGGGADGAAPLPPPGAGGGAPTPPPAALPLPAVADALAVLRGQMRHDVIGQQLTVRVCCAFVGTRVHAGVTVCTCGCVCVAVQLLRLLPPPLLPPPLLLLPLLLPPPLLPRIPAAAAAAPGRALAG
jgi:hypothetical protein